MIKLYSFVIKMLNRNLAFLILAVILFFNQKTNAGSAQTYLDKGWNALVKDHEIEALNFFNKAYEVAKKENNSADIAASLLNLGICSYSVSYSKGLDYCFQAMAEYKKIELSSPKLALEGRSRCLQLISTIYSRQGKYKEAISLSKEALKGFPPSNDKSGYLGLIYNSLGIAYGKLNNFDSSEYYHRHALEEHLLSKSYVYLPNSYLNVADLELMHEQKIQSRYYYDRAIIISDSTGNRQAHVTALLGLGKWYMHFEKDNKTAEEYFLKARNIGLTLLDKNFYLKALTQLQELKKQEGDFHQAFIYQEEIGTLKDTLNSWEKEKTLRILEVQFNVSEKDRQLLILQKEKDISSLTNLILFGTISFLILISIGIIFFLKRINRRDKQLLQTKEELVHAIGEQKRLKEQQLQNDLEFKENQLSAMTFQMLQKNEIMHELKERIDQDHKISEDNSLNKIINKGLNHDKDWKDFNNYFESLNKNFYVNLKLQYPDISPNDLKICALIKLNLSIKEMASILNISPDSVKTARYRLRKKLQLNTEDNLTEFILSL